MKKWMAFLLLVVMMLSLVACAESVEEEAQPTGDSLSGEQQTEEPSKTEENPEASDMIETEEVSESQETTVTEEVTETQEVAESEPVQETFWAEEDLEYPMDFYFSTGAGAWGTELYLNEDGTFTGYFHDTNMGEFGDNYPNGTVYLCEFSGKFSAAERLDMYTYSVKLEELTLDRPAGEEWIEDGVRYVSSTPYGLENSEDFMIYLPNTPTYMLSEDDLFWWPGRYYEEYTTLNGYGLYNQNDRSGFFSMLNMG